jgi:PAS domain S-box-containing protein
MRWGLAVAAPCAAAALSVGLQSLTGGLTPYLLFYFPGLVVTALRAGRGPGFLALVLSAVLAGGGWQDHRPGEPLLGLRHLLALAGFLLVGAIIVLITERMHVLTRQMRAIQDAQRGEIARHEATAEALRASEARLEIALRTQSLGTWELDVTTGAMQVSESLHALFSIGRDDASREEWLARVHPDDRSRVEQELTAASRGETRADTEFRMLVEGEERWVRASATLIAAPDGSRRLIGLAGDVSVRKQELEETKRDREELKAMLDLMPIGVAVSHDPEADRITVSPSLAAMLRLGPNQNASYTGPGHERIPFRCLRDGREVAGSDLPLQVTSRTGVPLRDVELDFAFADGEVKSLIISSAPLFDGQGQVRGAIGTHVDVTALKRAHRELELADRQKDEFLATLAHELRNPMAPIRYASAILKNNPSPQQLDQVRTTIDRQSALMARLLDDLLDMSRITRNVIDLKRENLDLRPLLIEAVETARPAIEERRHRLVVDAPAYPVPVHGDAVRLLQIFGNIIGNASKYTEPGGRIDVRLERRADAAHVTIADTGVGLSPAMLPKVFQLFAQVHPTNTIAAGGLGIGLAVVKRLAELHGGDVSVESRGLGQGSTFIVRLPLSTAELVAAAEVDAKPALRGAPRALVVDDNHDAAKLLASILRGEGLEVRLAHDGRTALDLAEAWRPDVIVLDIGLPEMSGYDVATNIRKRSWGGDVRIIGVTGWGQAEDRRRTLAAGFDRHLVKPVDPEQLLLVIGESTARPSAASG